ncbi:hypothetical protein SDC9_153264 [bioreactor metagenome]|uniref:Uncharacterized protein n=1 Tax=bioreactor metagenome TaxID=1076179 RepID=A0A645EX35_9ZZZZ
MVGKRVGDECPLGIQGGVQGEIPVLAACHRLGVILSPSAIDRCIVSAKGVAGSGWRGCRGHGCIIGGGDRGASPTSALLIEGHGVSAWCPLGIQGGF